MIDQETIIRLHAQQKRGYARDTCAQGIVNGVIGGAVLWVGLYGFLRLMVWVLGNGR